MNEALANAMGAAQVFQHDRPRWMRHKRKPRIGTRPGRGETSSKWLVQFPSGDETIVCSRDKKRRLVRDCEAKVLKRYTHKEWVAA